LKERALALADNIVEISTPNSLAALLKLGKAGSAFAKNSCPERQGCA
jgi:hypothetical protein